jgi:hypothetical protein
VKRISDVLLETAAFVGQHKWVPYEPEKPGECCLLEIRNSRGEPENTPLVNAYTACIYFESFIGAQADGWNDRQASVEDVQRKLREAAEQARREGL